jgi:hypothetical protein
MVPIPNIRRVLGFWSSKSDSNLLVEIPGMENKSLSTIWAEAARAATKPHKAITFHMVSSLMAEEILY